MERMLEWVKQIACYLIFVTVLADLLPRKSYEKYFRLFAGLILILLVLQPLTGPLELDARIRNGFEGIQYEEAAEEFRQRASQMEEERFDQITQEYEKMLEEDVEAMAKKEGHYGAQARVAVGRDPKKDGYGQIQEIKLSVWDQEAGWEAAAVPQAEIQVGKICLDGPAALPEAGEGEEHSAEILALKSRIAEEYGLEEDHVEIQWKED